MAISYEVPDETPDDALTVLDAIIAQILGFHRCLEEGLQPDSPSANGVISRVVGGFPHARRGGNSAMRILIAGEVNPDLILENYRTFPQLGEEVLVDDLLLTVGGSSAICAVGLARLGDRVTFAANVGADTYGDLCIGWLEREGIDVSLVNRRTDLKTGITVSITSSKDRALVTYLRVHRNAARGRSA